MLALAPFITLIYRRILIILISIAGTCFHCPLAHAQTAPDAGALLRDLEQTGTHVQPSLTPAPTTTAKTPAPHAKGESKVLVKDFHINTELFTEGELKNVIKDYIGKELTLAELEEAALKISDYYRTHGFMARAYLPRQTVKDGIITITVLEGVLENITVSPSSVTRFNTDSAIKMIAARLHINKPMRSDKLQGALAILNETPGIIATATLQPGTKEGSSIVVLTINDTPLINGVVQSDNGGATSVGSVRLIGYGSVNNPWGAGEQITAMAAKTTHSNYLRMSVGRPIGASGLSLAVNSSALSYSVAHAFNTSDQDGYAYTAGIVAKYPLIRKPSLSLSMQFNYDHKHLVNSIIDLNSSDKQVNVVQMSLSGVKTDTLLGGGGNNFGIGASIGNLDLSRNLGNLLQDRASAKTDGFYSKLTANFSRIQKITAKTVLFLSANGQIAPQNLDSSEQMSLGGPEGVRAYPTNEAYGDNGLILKAELRRDIINNIQLFGFYDIGWIQQHSDKWAGWNAGTSQPNAYGLQGAGVGASWMPKANIRLQMTLAHAIGSNPGKGNDGDFSDGRDEKLRLWFQVGILF